MQGVGGRTAQGRGAEVAQQVGLATRGAARGRDHRGTDALGTAVGAQTAGEQAVAVGHMHDVRLVDAGGGQAAAGQFGPVVQVAGGIAHHHGLAGGAAGGVQADDVVTRHGEKTEGIVIAQVLLFGEGQVLQIGQALDVAGLDTALVEAFAVERHIGIDTGAKVLQTAQLQGFDIFAGQRFLVDIENHGVSP